MASSVVVADEDGAVIAAPRLVGGKGMKMDARVDRRVGFLQRGADVDFVLGREDIDVDLLALGEKLGQSAPRAREWPRTRRES